MKLNVISVCTQYTAAELLAHSARARAQSDFLKLQWEQGAAVRDLDGFLDVLQQSVNENPITVILDGSEGFYSKAMIAEGLDLQLAEEEQSRHVVEEYCQRRRISLNDRVLEGCRLPVGTKPMNSYETVDQGFILTRGSRCIVVFPAVKKAFGEMFSNGFYPFLLKSGMDSAVVQTIAIRESKVSDVEEYLRLFKHGKHVLPLLYQEGEEHFLSITAIRSSEEESRQACESLLENLEAEMGSVVLTAANSKKEKKLVKKKSKALQEIEDYDPKEGKSEAKEKKGGFGMVRKLLLLLCICTFLGSAGYLGLRFYQSVSNLQGYESLREVYDNGGFPPIGYPADYDNDFSGLWQINPDVVGWLSIEGTSLDYPVVQTTDNTFYHRLNFEGESNLHGVPFVDCNVDLKEPSNNTIIYGHNIKNDDQMFNSLLKYWDPEYYKEHPIVEFHTVYGKRQYKIFAAFVANVNPSHGEVFQYHTFVDAVDLSDIQEYIYNVQVRNILNTGVDVLPSDKLLTLSTCTYEFDNARFVIVARELRAGESPEIDPSAVSKNSSPLMPDIWYQLYGGTKPVLEVPTFSDAAVLSNNSSPETKEEIKLNDDFIEASFEGSAFATLSALLQNVEEEPEKTEENSNQPPVTQVAPPTTETQPPKEEEKEVPKVESVTILSSNSSLHVGTTMDLQAAVEPQIPELTYQWKSSNPTVATVDSEGTVTAIAAGEITISLTVKNPQNEENTMTTAPLALTITTPLPTEKVQVDEQDEINLTLTEGSSTGVTASGSSAYTWTSSNAAVATVSKRGTITAVSVGTATITVTGAQGDTAEVYVTVEALPETILLNGESSLTLNLKTGESSSVTASGSDSYTWKSSNEAVAEVSNKGKIYANAAGTATITVSGKAGGTATISVVVTAAPTVEQPKEEEEEEKPSSSIDKNETLSVKINGSTKKGSAYDIVCMMVQAEMGSSFHQEALKAQAVAAYTYVKYNNNAGIKPAVSAKTSISSNVAKAVEAVLGEAIYYNGSYINATYCAANAGVSNNCVDVWGGNLPYLVSVDSEGDKETVHYGYKTSLSRSYVEERIEDYLNIKPSGDPSEWFGDYSYGAGKYIDTIEICGSRVKGRKVRENLLQSKIRSSAFEVEYDAGSDKFIFTTYGYGHGVGMSQLGANYYAKQGWTYEEILEHYYSGAQVK